MEHNFLYAQKDLAILVVEDDSVVRDNMTTILKRRFDDVYSVDCVVRALEIYKSKKVDLIITDITMKGASGLDLAREIRETNSEIPIIFLTAYNDTSYMLQAIELRISNYLTKPLNLKKLLYEIDMVAKVIYLQKEQKNQTELFLALSENSLAAIFFGSEKFEYTNRAFCELTKYSHNELANMHIYEIFKKDAQQRVKIATDKRRDGEKLDSRKNEFEIITKDGDTRWVYAQTTTLFFKNRYSTLGNLIDITDLKELHIKLEKLASIDQLTGAYNRRKFEEILNSEIEKAREDGAHFSMIMYDLDYFKRINDDFGHSVGDVALKMSVEIIKNELDKNCYLSRWGGEEFVILLQNRDLNSAYNLAQKLSKLLEDFVDSRLPKMTASFGVVEFREGDCEDSIIKRVDRALYEAKRLGRNRVELGE